MAEKFGLLQGKFGADADGNIELDAVELDRYLRQLEFEFVEGGDDGKVSNGHTANDQGSQ